MKRAALIMGILALGLAACEPTSDTPKVTGFVVGDGKPYDKDLYEDQFFNYVQDTRTGLCFATGRLGYGEGVLTNVPCSPEVLALVRRPGEINSNTTTVVIR